MHWKMKKTQKQWRRGVKIQDAGKQICVVLEKQHRTPRRKAPANALDSRSGCQVDGRELQSLRPRKFLFRLPDNSVSSKG